MIDQKTKNDLINEARSALENAYPQVVENFTYSAAVLTKTGEMYSASNYRSNTASLTLHSEQSALAHAAAHGQKEIIAIAVASNEKIGVDQFTPPCHMCKQLLWESSLNSGESILVILTNNHNQTKEIPLEEMMTYPWPEKK